MVVQDADLKVLFYTSTLTFKERKPSMHYLRRKKGRIQKDNRWKEHSGAQCQNQRAPHKLQMFYYLITIMENKQHRSVRPWMLWETMILLFPYH